MCKYKNWKFYWGLLFLIITCHCQAALVDPTLPANYNPTAVATTLGKGLSLDAIFYSQTAQYAIINGQTLHQGDSIAGFRLLQIKSQAVLLKGPNGAFELPLYTLQVKQQAATNGVDTQ